MSSFSLKNQIKYIFLPFPEWLNYDLNTQSHLMGQNNSHQLKLLEFLFFEHFKPQKVCLVFTKSTVTLQ